MKDCPQGFINVGAYSVLLRHELESKDEHWRGAYEGMLQALAAAEKDLKSLGFAKMELADGEDLFLDAADLAAKGDFHRAEIKARRGHNSWRLMLLAHGIKAPTDDDILKAHVSIHGATMAKGGAISLSLKALSTLGNWR